MAVKSKDGTGYLCQALARQPSEDAHNDWDYAPCKNEAVYEASHPSLPRKYYLCWSHSKASQFRRFTLRDMRVAHTH